MYSRRATTAAAIIIAVCLFTSSCGSGSESVATGPPDPYTSANGPQINGPSGSPELPPSANPGPLLYVALGDSYSSGEGDPFVSDEDIQRFLDQPQIRRANLPDDFVEINRKQIEETYGWLGSTGSSGNKFHRSDHAYPVRVWTQLEAQDPNWGLAFRACSGARTSAMRGEPFRDAENQFTAFTKPAQLVTIGIGGNDLGFADIIRDCVAETLANRYRDILPVDPGQVVDPGESRGDCERIWSDRLPGRIQALRSQLQLIYGSLTTSKPGFTDESRLLIVS